MHLETLKQIVAELDEALTGQQLGRIVQLSTTAFVFEFGVRDGHILISVDPSVARIHLAKRKTRELEKNSIPLGMFGQALRATLSKSRLTAIAQEGDDRIVRLSFAGTDEMGDATENFLLAQLTGRSANLLLLDSANVISHSLRAMKGEGQEPGDLYSPPQQAAKRSSAARISQEQFPTLSAAIDDYYQKLEAERSVDELGKSLLQSVRTDITRQQRLKKNLQKDLIDHGDPQSHKRMGDLLLANLTSAQRSGNQVVITDYYAEGTPSLQLEIDENISLQEAAKDFFSRYTKAKRAVEEISKRANEVERTTQKLEARVREIETAIANHDEAALTALAPKKPARSAKQIEAVKLPGMRRYESSDGYEVIVGRTARDNEKVTFQVGLPNDLWLHAADYPGSHVIVRNSSRKEIPHRTVVEAAQLAAKFSQASKDAKVSVHYTPRKFVSKIKGAAPGLVRLSRFKTITVAPGETLKRL